MNDEHFEDALANDDPILKGGMFDGASLGEVSVGNCPTTIGVHIKDAKRLYTYQCARPVHPGDRVNVKLPHAGIITLEVIEVHDTPQLSDKWETKWAVVVETKAEHEARSNLSSELGTHLGL